LAPLFYGSEGDTGVVAKIEISRNPNDWTTAIAFTAMTACNSFAVYCANLVGKSELPKKKEPGRPIVAGLQLVLPCLATALEI
jgi:hypothetical protein